MPQEFDPYHRWLGIPVEEQPADHYRLLGLVRFEDDIEVIRDGAERQIAHVRGKALGKHSELSQRILNELAAAKACLLDREDKARYDAQLHKKIEASASPPPLDSAPGLPQSPVGGSPAPGVEPPRPPQALSPAVRPAKRSRAAARPDRGNAARWLVVGGICGAGLGVVALVVWAVVLQGPATDGGTAPVGRAGGTSDQPNAQLMPQAQYTTRPPKLARIADQTAEEGQPLEVAVKLTDRGSAPGPLLYAILQAPPGAKIDAESGRFTWTPGADHARMKYAVTVQVVARDASELADRVSFVVDVREALVLPPTLATIREWRLSPGSKTELPVKGSDPNRPPRKLTYSLKAAPPWIRIDETSGTLTAEPPEDHEGGVYPVQVRVVSDAPKAPFAEASFAAVVAVPSPAPPATPSKPAEEDLAGLRAIKGLSGPLNPLQMNMRQTAFAAAHDLMYRLGADQKVTPLFAGAFGGQLVAVAELNKANKLDGVVVSFHAGKDPITCMNSRVRAYLSDAPRPSPRRTLSSTRSGTTVRPPMEGSDVGAGTARRGGAAPSPPGEDDEASEMGPSAFQVSRARENAAQSCWGDVRIEAYLQFKQGDRTGMAAIWDADGQRVFWGQYLRGKRHDLCCLFKNDRPRIAVTFDDGKPGSVYLVSNNRVEKDFASREEALQDAAAQPLLEELDEIESKCKRGELESERQIRKTVQFKLGNLNEYKRALGQMRRAGREKAQKQGLQDSIRASGL